ncbi:membrane protein [Thalassospira sp. HJ]|uniref:YqaA family protein n=1 Tax=Thalassospira sp. HJ TaxID=1616823 RepID=UPI0005CEB579|nr:YqaA family protein [Thalassospira sp. HJ]KJE34543.1 membrane protein [Thalassospira sp. HJ]
MTTTFTLLTGLFFSALTSATILPGTSEAALAAMIASGDHAVWLLVVVATAGNVLGSLVNWWLGLYAEHFKHKRWFPVSADALDRASRWFGKYGLWSLLLAWLPIIGDPLTLFAGVMRVRFVPFIILVTIGKAARYAMIAGGASALAKAFGV